MAVVFISKMSFRVGVQTGFGRMNEDRTLHSDTNGRGTVSASSAYQYAKRQFTFIMETSSLVQARQFLRVSIYTYAQGQPEIVSKMYTAAVS